MSDGGVEALLGLRPLVVGECVRVRPRIECRRCWGVRFAADGSPEDWDGVEAVVVGVEETGDTHPYVVRPSGASGFAWADWYVARTEIEPLRERLLAALAGGEEAE